MARQKILGTDLFIGGDLLCRLRKAGYVGTQGQVRVLCKCTGLKDAQAKCEACGIYGKWRSGYACETENAYEKQFMQNCEIALSLRGVGGIAFISYEDLMRITLE